MGEVGLAGEVRGVSRLDVRLGEAAKLGFKRAYLPQNDLKRIDRVKGLDLIGLGGLSDLLEALSLKRPCRFTPDLLGCRLGRGRSYEF